MPSDNRNTATSSASDISEPNFSSRPRSLNICGKKDKNARVFFEGGGSADRNLSQRIRIAIATEKNFASARSRRPAGAKGLPGFSTRIAYVPNSDLMAAMKDLSNPTTRIAVISNDDSFCRKTKRLQIRLYVSKNSALLHERSDKKIRNSSAQSDSTR